MKRNGIDSWCKIPVETIDVGGVKVTVNGLTVSQLASLTSGKLSNIDQSVKLICACCDVDGEKIRPETLNSSRADIFKTLSEVVARVNGLAPGNLNATDGENSSSD